GHGQEGAAPVGGAAGEDVGEVPAGGGVAAAGLDLALDDTEHPAGANGDGEGAVDEGLAAAPVPLGLVVREAVGRGVGQQRPAVLQFLVVDDVQLAVGGVVAL